MLKWLILGLDVLLGLYLMNFTFTKWVVPASITTLNNSIFLIAGILLIVSGIGFYFWRSASESSHMRR